MDDYSRGIAEGLEMLLSENAVEGESISDFIHATTVATNAILELKGAKTGLITTKGFRDVLEIGRVRGPELYNMSYSKAKPLVERFLRFEIDERMDADGQALHGLDTEEARSLVDGLLSLGVESLAVCLLHSYANADHEAALAELVRREYPQLCLSVSSEVVPEIKEFERTSTTVINAYVMPVVDRYLQSLEKRLSEMEIEARPLIMQSSGGIMSAEAARRKPIHIIESGPAAGVIASANLAKKLSLPNVLTLDMGGTTAKAAIIEQGEFNRTFEFSVGAGISTGPRAAKVGGYALRAPAIDLAEVGAGGGSIIRIDKGGSLRIGPNSAGACPGPVCYDLGGDEPTITDANVVLGYLNPDYLVGGALAMNTGKAFRAMEEKIAGPLGLGAVEAAYGAHLIANANMIRAVRAVSTERGRDPRDFVLFAFGGNGPVHAAEMARSLGVRKVVVPISPGLYSALGLLFTENTRFYVQTHLRNTRDLTVDQLEGVFKKMETEALSEVWQEGYRGADVILRRFADLRYVRQSYELMVPVPEGKIGPEVARELETLFHEEHKKTYGYEALNSPVQLVNLRLSATVLPKESSLDQGGRIAERPADGASNRARLNGSRRAYFGEASGHVDTSVVQRGDLAGSHVEGPVIVEEYDSTTVIPPGCKATLDAWGNIIIDTGL